jgi:type I restriction enzyme R subunit
MPRRRISEARTRKELIDLQLKKAGWDVRDGTQVGIEIPVDGFDPDAWNQLEKQLRQIREQAQIKDINLPAGISDYVLYHENGEILAVVEAKKTSVDPRLAAAQIEFYVTQIEKRQSFRPFEFMTNGQEIYFYDVGYQNKREVQGFFSKLDLETQLHIRQNKIPLSEVEINREIADHTHQMETMLRVKTGNMVHLQQSFAD